MSEENRKRPISPSSSDGGDEVGKRPKTPSNSESSNSNISIEDFLDDTKDEGIPIKEESVLEMMKVLERELSSNIKESCGPSISDASSTVMASIDTRVVSSISYLMEHTDFFPPQSAFYQPPIDGVTAVMRCLCVDCVKKANAKDQQEPMEEANGNENDYENENADDEEWIDQIISDENVFHNLMD